MPTYTSSAQTPYQALAALARWLPTAPHDAAELGAALTDLLAAELPTLPVSLALQHGETWQLFGVATPEAHSWIAQLNATQAGVARRSSRRARQLEPRRSVVLEPHVGVRVGVAVWDTTVSRAAFDALTAQIALAFTRVEQPLPSQPTLHLHERPGELAALQRIARKLNGTLNLDLILDAILHEASAVTGATCGGIALWQGKQNGYRYVAATGLPPAETTSIRQYELGFGASSADEAVQHDRIQLTPFARDHADPFGAQQATSKVDVPIHYGNRVAGLISLRSTTPETFHHSQLPFLSLVADQTAVAVGNAEHVAEQLRQRELLQQRATVLSEVLEVGHLLRADRELSDMLTDIAYGIVNAVGFRSVIINLRSERDSSTFNPIAFAGILPEEAERIRNSPVPAQIVESLCDPQWQISSSFFIPGDGVYQVFGDDLERLTTTTISEQRQSNEWQSEDMFVTPLHGPSGEVIGFVSVDDPFDRRRPTRRIAEAVEIFANQAAAAVDNVRLYNDAQRRLAEQNALNRIHQAISASLDIRHILREVYAGLKPALAMDSYYSIVYHHDSTTTGLEVSCDLGEWEEAEMRMDRQTGLHAYMMRQQQPLLFGELSRESDRLPEAVRPVTFGDHTRASASWMGVPLVAADQEVIGALSVHSYTPHRFGQHELMFLQAVAHQVAISLQNARLFAERERRLNEANVINQLAQAFTAPITLDELAEVLCSQISQALNTDSIWLAVYDRRNDVLEYPLFVDRGVRYLRESRRSTFGATEYMLRTRRPLLLNDDIPAQLTTLNINVIGEVSQSFVATPLLVGEEAVGVIAIQNYERNHAFGQNELELLQAIALQIASGIEKARLLQERERQIAQMQALNNIGKVTSSLLDLDELFMGMYVELNRYRRTDALMLVVCDPETYTIKRLIAVDRGKMYLQDSPLPIPARSYTDAIMRKGLPILLHNAVEEEALHGIESYIVGEDDQPASWVGVPLLTTVGQPFGLISMQGYAIGEYDLRDVEFLTSVAHQIALSIQNATLFNQSQTQVKQLAAETERLELINRVSSWTSAMLDTHELLQRTVNEMGRVTNADQARLMMFDRPRGVGICHAELHDTGAVGQMVIPLVGNPSIEWMDQHQSSMLASDVANDPRFEPMHELLRELNIRDLLIVPLIVKGQVIGSVGLDTQNREHSFSERDIATCETIANQVATAIENAQLWKTTQQSVHELTMLYDLSVSLTTMLDLDEILATLAGAALEIEHADASVLMLVDSAGHISQCAGLNRAGDEVDPTPLQGNRVIAQTMRDGRPFVINDTHEAPEPVRLDDHTRSCIIVPIIVKGQPVGVVMVGANRPRVWSDREQSLVTILTSQAASAIENAHLFKSEQEKRRLADTLREVALALTSTLDPQEVLERVLGLLRRVVPYESTSVQLLRDGNQLEVISRRGHDGTLALDGQDVLFACDNPRDPSYHVVTTHQPYIVNDAWTEYPFFQESPQTSHIRSWLGVPLLYGNEMLGLITLDSGQSHFYSPEMADLALMFATQAAQAIAHARLFEQIRRFNVELEGMVAERTAALTAEKERLEAVHAITTTLAASLDIDEIVLKMLELAAGALGVQRGSVLIRDPMRNTLVYRAVLSETEGLFTSTEPFDLPSGNLVEWTLEHQQGVCIADVRYDPRWISAGSHTTEIRSFIAVPLLTADLPLGVLMLNSRQPGYFGEEHLRLLSTIASEVAIAVHNAELYNFINEQATRLAELLQGQREETGKNRAILESVAEGVLVLDEQDTVVLYNRAASQVLRLSEAVIEGRAIDRIAEYGDAGDERQRALLVYDTLSEGIRGARQQTEPVHLLLELPGQTIDTTFTPVTTPDGERMGVAAVLRDITREIEADKVKREFISTVSHELRTPLTSVKGYVDLLMLGTAGPISDMQKTFLQVVKSNADRLNALVEDLLEISRLENGKVALNYKPLVLPELISDIVDSLRTETQRKRMQLSLEIEPTLPTVEADIKRIGQVLTNLMSNAHKYTRDGGTITVRCYQRDSMVQVDVVDTGVGIPSEELSKMFSRFFRANNSLKEEVGGTGLGLSIAKSFVELHGGDMWVTSQLEVGSTFSFTLPLAQRRPQLDEIPDGEVVHAD